MFKFLFFAALFAVAAAGNVAVYGASPLAYSAYTSPVAYSAYSSPLAYSAYGAYPAYSAYSGYSGYSGYPYYGKSLISSAYSAGYPYAYAKYY